MATLDKRPLSNIRNRRLVAVAAVSACALLLYFQSSFRAGGFRWDLMQVRGRAANELDGLLYYVTSSSQNILPEVVNPDSALPSTLYSKGQKWNQQQWQEKLNTLYRSNPVIVFSKTYCPYSKRAKDLLQSYRLDPPPTIIEVDIRTDGDQIKALLTRLTKHSTFPNIIIAGRSLGGSDNLQELHASGKLTDTLEKAGARMSYRTTV